MGRWVAQAVLLLLNALVWVFVAVGLKPIETLGNQCSTQNPKSYLDCFLTPFRGLLDFIEDHDAFIVAAGTIAIAAFTYALWRSTYLLWKEARDAANLTLKLHEAEQRPWLSFGLTSTLQTLRRDNYAEVTYLPVIRNVGHSPAFDARVYHALMRDFDSDPGPNFDLFVANSKETHNAPGRDRRSAVVWPEMDAPQARGETVEEHRGTPQTMLGRFYLLFICLCYRAKWDGDIHTTATLYRLDLVSGDFTSGEISFGADSEERPRFHMGFNVAD